MQILVWSLVLVASVWAAHWGSDRVAKPLEKLRRQWGLSEAAGAAFVALATASPQYKFFVTPRNDRQSGQKLFG